MTAETELPAYLPYPRFLLKMDISHTAKLLYVLLLDRSTLSQKNGWQDSEGRIYIVYPIAEIAEMLDKGCTTIKGALNELDAAGLLERRRTGFSAANRLYVKVPPIPVVQFSDQLTDGKPTLIRAGNRPTDSRKTDLMTVGKPSPNQTKVGLRASMARSMKEVHTINYYPINEGAARRAKEMSTVPTTASVFLNIPVPNTAKSQLESSARHSTVSMKMWYCPLFPKC